MISYSEKFLSSQKDVKDFEKCLEKSASENCTETLHKVYDRMSLLINAKFESLKKKKDFYKNFKSKNQMSMNDRDYENLEKIA
jgi:hypothetical protein